MQESHEGRYVPEIPANPASYLLKKLLRGMGNPAIRFVLWTGEEVAASNAPPLARIGIANQRALLRLLADPQLQFGELYVSGDLTIDGDPAALLAEVYYRAYNSLETPPLQRLRRWLQRLRHNTPIIAQRNARRHYDLGNAFYALWLDESLTYSCAYFASPEISLHQAQLAKMDHIGRKLRLQPGQSVLEIGSGWGSLAMHLARRFGVTVTGFNVSQQQLAYARERVEREGLAGQVSYVEADYRSISGSYDAMVSIGMLEHVGVRHYREFGEVLHRCLKSSGIGLIQSIGRNRPAPVNPWIAKHIFPGGYVPSLKEMMGIFEPRDFSILDVENLRPHYARTLEYWRRNFEQARVQVAQMFDEAFVRMWRLYLSGSMAAFRCGDMQLFQVLFSPGANANVPWTREHLYRGDV